VLRIAILFLLLPGCLWATTSSDKVSGYEVRGIIGQDNRGANAQVMGGMAGLHGELEAGVREFRRDVDPNTYTGGGVGVNVRLSPFGVLASEHRLERYFDFGAEIGGELTAVFGAPAHNFVPTGWVGGWVELGTIPVGDGYLALTGNIRSAAPHDTWHDQVLIGIGIAFRHRAKVTSDDLDFHD
jgi:hypothetical protein